MRSSRPPHGATGRARGADPRRSVRPGGREARGVAGARRQARRARVGVAVAAALLAGGCGGGSTRDETAGLSPTQILAKGIAAARGVSGYTLTIRLSASGAPAGGAAPQSMMAGLLEQGLELEGVGPQRPPDGALSLTAKAGLLALPIDLTKVDGGVYLDLVTTVARLDLPRATVARMNLDALRLSPLTWLGRPIEVGRERVDGSPTVHLSGRIETAKASEDLAGALGAARSLGLLPAAAPSPDERREQVRQLRAALRDTAIDAWIGTADLQPRRVAAAVRIGSPVDLLPGIRSTSIDLQTDVSDVGASEPVRTPAATRTVKAADLDSLFSAIGGG